MATQAIEKEAESDQPAPPAKPKRMLKIILAVVGIGAGVPTGLFVAGPMVAKHRAAAAAAPAAEPQGSAVFHPIENLVLNPAGSGGTRFLMVTATFELKNAGVEQAMKDREAEVRDHILALLGKLTVEDLSDYTKRDGIKQQVLSEVQSLFPKGDVQRLFFPQFVIQ